MMVLVLAVYAVGFLTGAFCMFWGIKFLFKFEGDA